MNKKIIHVLKIILFNRHVRIHRRLNPQVASGFCFIFITAFHPIIFAEPGSVSQTQIQRCENIYKSASEVGYTYFKPLPLTQLKPEISLNKVTRANPWHFFQSKQLQNFVLRNPDVMKYWGLVRLDTHSGNTDVVIHPNKVTMGLVDYDDIRKAPLIFELLKKVVIVKTTTAAVSTRDIVDYYIKGLQQVSFNPHDFLDLPEGRNGSRVYRSKFDLKQEENKYAVNHSDLIDSSVEAFSVIRLKSSQKDVKKSKTLNVTEEFSFGSARRFKNKKEYHQVPIQEKLKIARIVLNEIPKDYIVHDIVEYKKSGGGSFGAKRYRILVQDADFFNRGKNKKWLVNEGQSGFKVVELKEKYESKLDMMYSWLKALMNPDNENYKYEFTTKEFEKAVKEYRQMEESFNFAVENSNHPSALLSVVQYDGRTYLLRDKVIYFLDIDQEAEKRNELKALRDNLYFDAYLSGMYASLQLLGPKSSVLKVKDIRTGQYTDASYLQWFLENKELLIAEIEKTTQKYLKKLDSKIQKQLSEEMPP